jgi:hypothetical protein
VFDKFSNIMACQVA